MPAQSADDKPYSEQPIHSDRSEQFIYKGVENRTRAKVSTSNMGLKGGENTPYYKTEVSVMYSIRMEKVYCSFCSEMDDYAMPQD